MTGKTTRNGDVGDSFLLVGENQAFLDILELYLVRHSASRDIYTATDGEAALVLARAVKPQVMLVDLDMAAGDSLSVIEEMRCHARQGTIIALSLLESNAYRRMALVAGADDFISKAQLSALLMPSIRRAREPDFVDGLD